ncbi:hypothetical protein [Clostridium aciditolerans]|uniref:hypothetical protein n=1 Tax=Clostridium aciditolerans TaxID=339861 RepID=UPI001FEB6F48|nr:hypothetical protein [Clostridium aciditolerans]
MNEAINHYREKYGIYCEIDNYLVYFEPHFGVLKYFNNIEKRLLAMKKKITDEQLERSMTLLTTAMDNYTKDDEVF